MVKGGKAVGLSGSIAAVTAFCLLTGCGQVRFAAAEAEKASQCDECATGIPVTETLYTSVTNKVDIVFVVDSSGSMSAERAELGARLQNFTSSLGSLDWQICVTTTDAEDERGRFLPFGVSGVALTSSAPNFNQLFLNRLMNIPRGSGDEEGIRSLGLAIERNDPGCIRRDAALAAIVLSDEDERSAGGDPAWRNDDQWRELGPDNLAQSIPSKVAASMGQGKIFTAHAVVIPTGDDACRAAQLTSGNKAFFGAQYEKLARLTGGVIGNICASDYSAQLANFAQTIRRTLDSVTLKCVPLVPPQVNLTPARPGVTITPSGNKLLFSPAVPQGTAVEVSYLCPGSA